MTSTSDTATYCIYGTVHGLTGIWTTGRTPEEAMKRFIDVMGLEPDEADVALGRMTARLAGAIQLYGYDAAHPPFDWCVRPDGRLDLDED